MLQDKKRTESLQQHVLSKRLGPADATQPRPPPSPEREATAVRCEYVLPFWRLFAGKSDFW